MNTIDLFESVRNYIADDADMRSLLNQTTKANTLKVILFRDGEYISIKDRYQYPAIAIAMADDDTPEAIASNNVFLHLMPVNTVANANCMKVNYMIKDRLRELLDNKTNDDTKHVAINAQALALGLSLKVRGVFWVSASPYEDKEQGSERLHKISCFIKMVVGD